MSDVATNASASNGAQRYHFLIPAWGDAYVRKLIDFGLPCLLSPGNLPALPRPATLVQIFTLSSNVGIIEESAVYRRLQDSVSTSIELIDDVDRTNHYYAMTECYNRGLTHSEEIDTAFIFLTADSVWSDGSFRRMDEILRTGKRAIMVTGLSVEQSTGIRALQAEYLSTDGTQITITGREFVKLALDHWNIISIARLVMDDHALAAEQMYWDLGASGLLVRCFHMHPMVVRPIRRDARIDVTVDVDYVEKTCLDREDIYVVTDSDEICCCEFSTSASREMGVAQDQMDVNRIADWVRTEANETHRAFAEVPIFYHSGDRDEAWQPVVSESARFVNEILRLAERPPAPEKPAKWQPRGLFGHVYSIIYRIGLRLYRLHPAYYRLLAIEQAYRQQHGQSLILQRRLTLLSRRYSDLMKDIDVQTTNKCVPK